MITVFMRNIIKNQKVRGTVLDDMQRTTTSLGSRGPGFLVVLTAQNLQPLVQESPISMMVAVAVCPSLPPQHSPMFGHLASSQTVLKPSFLKSLLIWVNFSPPGSSRFSHSGFLVFSWSPIQLFKECNMNYCRGSWFKTLPSNLLAYLVNDSDTNSTETKTLELQGDMRQCMRKPWKSKLLSASRQPTDLCICTKAGMDSKYNLDGLAITRESSCADLRHHTFQLGAGTEYSPASPSPRRKSSNDGPT